MYEKEIIADVVNYLTQIEDVTVIPYDDFTERRDPAMIVVGIEDTTQVNYSLDDFRYTMSVTINVMIDQDKDGRVMQGLREAVIDMLTPIFDDPERYGDVFADLDRIVYFHFDRMTPAIIDRVNTTTISIEIIGSFN